MSITSQITKLKEEIAKAESDRQSDSPEIPQEASQNEDTQKMPMTTKILIGVGVATVIGLGVWFFLKRRKK